MIKFLDKTSPWLILVGNFFLVSVLGFLDYLTGNELSFYIFYFLPIALISWYLNKAVSTGFIFLCISVWFWAHYLDGLAYSSNYIFLWNMGTRFTVFLVISILIRKLKDNIKKSHVYSLKEQKKETIMKTSQRMVGVIAEYISIKNSEIVLWVHRRKNSGKKVPLVVESASRDISNCLRALTQIFYSDLFNKEKIKEEDYVDYLKKKLSDLMDKYALEDSRE